MGSRTCRGWVCAVAAIVLWTTWPAGAQAGDLFVVQFRLVKWRSAHFHDAERAATFHATLTSLGCEAQRHAHDGHEDVQYRCPTWRSLRTSSDDAAHRWEKWLRQHGFETAHQH